MEIKTDKLSVKGYAVTLDGNVSGFYTDFEDAVAYLKKVRYYLGFQRTDMMECVEVTNTTHLKNLDFGKVNYELSKVSLIPQLKAEGRI